MTSTERRNLERKTLGGIARLILSEEISPEKYQEFMESTGLARLDTEEATRLREIKNMVHILVQKVISNDTSQNLAHIYTKVETIHPI